jgi:hypothetical protein
MKYPNDNPETRAFCERMVAEQERLTAAKLLRWLHLDACEKYTRERIDETFLAYNPLMWVWQDHFGVIHVVPVAHPWLHVYVMIEEGVL